MDRRQELVPWMGLRSGCGYLRTPRNLGHSTASHQAKVCGAARLSAPLALLTLNFRRLGDMSLLSWNR